MKLIIATTAIALTAGTAFAQETAEEVMDLPKPTVAFVDAAGIAAGAAEGDLIGMELDYINDADPVYIADLEGETSFHRLMIDGDSGDVLVTESMTAQDEAALDAYLENFSTQSELEDMLMLGQMFDELEEIDGLEDLSEEDLDALEEMFHELDDEEADEEALEEAADAADEAPAQD